MKKKENKGTGSHGIGNRTVIGIICIVAALLICFGVAPVVNRISDGKVAIVRVVRQVDAGAVIGADDVAVVEVGRHNLPEGLVTKTEDVIGKCAKSDLYIEKFVLDNGYLIDGFTDEELVNRLYSEMVEYSILTPYLGASDIDEINVNAWDDVVLTYSDGRMVKTEEHFHSPGHAVDIVKRLLHHSGMIIDNAMPIAQGHLPGNTRITAIKSPVVDEDCGISVSIRPLHPQRVDRKCLIDSGMATEEIMEFLEMCVRYGVSLVVAGRTSSGKTTLLNALLGSIPDDKRIYTIESGARELFLIKRNRFGEVQNNVVHTLSRPSDNGAYNISQEELVVAALRFDPDIVAVGEIRDAEANSAVEASLTGHTVVTTVHSGPGEAAHGRIALLCQRRFELGMEVSLSQARQAFPLVVFAHKCEDNSRKVMDISEVYVAPGGQAEYRCLYRYNITENEYKNGHFTIKGDFEKVNPPSGHLCTILTRSGVPQELLGRFCTGRKEAEAE